MQTRKLARRSLAASLLVSLSACSTIPTAPSILALPGTNRTFDSFRADDQDCRLYASRQITVPVTDPGVQSAVVGTAVGAAAGAAIGGQQGAAVGDRAGQAQHAAVAWQVLPQVIDDQAQVSLVRGGGMTGRRRVGGTGQAAEQTEDERKTHLNCRA